MPFTCGMYDRNQYEKTKNHSLQVKKPLLCRAGKNCRKQERASLCSPSGSMTVESALSLPLFFLAMAVLLCFLDVFRIQVIVTSSLCQSAKELGMYAYGGDKIGAYAPVKMVDTAVSTAFAKRELKKRLNQEHLSGIKGGAGGITLFSSTVKNNRITLQAQYQYRPALSLLPLSPIKITSVGYARAWTGYDGGEDSGYGGSENSVMVYITPNEGVYHVREDCSYLELSIAYLTKSGLASARNQYGEKYHPCEKCVGKGSSARGYYITDKGDRYHSLRTCSGLTRTVVMVKKSQVGHLKACSRCGSHE